LSASAVVRGAGVLGHSSISGPRRSAPPHRRGAAARRRGGAPDRRHAAARRRRPHTARRVRGVRKRGAAPVSTVVRACRAGGTRTGTAAVRCPYRLVRGSTGWPAPCRAAHRGHRVLPGGPPVRGPV